MTMSIYNWITISVDGLFSLEVQQRQFLLYLMLLHKKTGECQENLEYYRIKLTL